METTTQKTPAYVQFQSLTEQRDRLAAALDSMLGTVGDAEWEEHEHALNFEGHDRETCALCEALAVIGWNRGGHHAAKWDALLVACEGLLNWGRDHLSPVHDPEAHKLLVAAHNAIAKVKGE
jgi:hypothetical protein